MVDPHQRLPLTMFKHGSCQGPDSLTVEVEASGEFGCRKLRGRTTRGSGRRHPRGQGQGPRQAHSSSAHPEGSELSPVGNSPAAVWLQEAPHQPLQGRAGTTVVDGSLATSQDITTLMLSGLPCSSSQDEATIGTMLRHRSRQGPVPRTDDCRSGDARGSGPRKTRNRVRRRSGQGRGPRQAPPSSDQEEESALIPIGSSPAAVWLQEATRQLMQERAGQLVVDGSLTKSKDLTTLRLSGLPCSISEHELMLAIDQLGFRHAYDFLYVPMSTIGLTRGDALVNFVSSSHASSFAAAFDNFRFSPDSEQRCSATFAHVQGKKACLEANMHIRYASLYVR